MQLFSVYLLKFLPNDIKNQKKPSLEINKLQEGRVRKCNVNLFQLSLKIFFFFLIWPYKVVCVRAQIYLSVH